MRPMRTLILGGLTAAMTLSVALPATAADRHDRNDRRGDNDVVVVKVDREKDQKQDRGHQRGAERSQDRRDARDNRDSRAAKARVTHRHSVGSRVSQDKVVVINDWQRRGLPRPARGENYVIDGSDIYLVAAASLLVKAIVD
ncbi:RcnB family protein [Pseudooceanicola aestuarii]|uniref:RcnB family protein n=1 Tax=Pseudooceanicola aestuarii TaxID=2697319 RepID=UPI0013D45D17|nr:RcnB family protein [Pseudooceanicola aestuarii]